MRKIILLSLVVLTCIAVQAQMADNSSGATTLKGCLQYTKHHYYLTDAGGKEHMLSGAATKLKAHVGHEIEVTGTEGTHAVNTTTDSMASSAHEVPVFNVTSIKHIADTCKAGT